MAIEVKGRTVETDDEGFLANPRDWDEDVMSALAAQEGLELTDTHWGLVEYVREYYEENQRHPSMHILVMTLGIQDGERFHNRKKYEKFLYELFPSGPIKVLCKLAGLTNPVGDFED